MANDSEKSVSANFSSFSVKQTYSGLIEGSRETASKYALEELSRKYPTDRSNNGYALVVPAGPRLPDWTCKAYLSSSYRFDSGDDGSTLSLCWFVDELKGSMQEMVDDALKQVDWHRRARAYDMCDF